jgi:hypothetical protein
VLIPTVSLKLAAGNPTVINIKGIGVKILRNLFISRWDELNIR